MGYLPGAVINDGTTTCTSLLVPIRAVQTPISLIMQNGRNGPDVASNSTDCPETDLHIHNRENLVFLHSMF